MDERLKRRVVGAAVLVVAVVVFVPMLLEQGKEAPDPRPLSTPPVSSQPPPPLPPPPEDAGVRVVPLNRPAPAAAAPADPPKPATAAKPAPAREIAPAKAAAVSTPPVTPGFAIQLGSFSKADNALGLRDTLKAKGYRAYVKTSGSITRVYVGPQQSRAEAANALKKLLTDTKMKGIVVNFSG
jgi:DedD protein